MGRLLLVAALVIGMPLWSDEGRSRAAALAEGDAELEAAIALLWGDGPPRDKVDRVFALGELGRTPRGLRAAGILVAFVDSGHADLDVEPPAAGKGYPTARFAAIRAIGRLGDGSLVPAVVPWLGHVRSDVRFATVQALGFIGDPLAIPHLRARLADPDEGVKDMAARHLEILEGLVAARAALSAPDPAARAKACAELAQRAQVGSAPAIAALLRDESDSVRAAAAAALGALREGSAIDALVPLLADSAPAVRREVGMALGKLGAVAHAAGVRALLSDADVGVRAASCYAVSLLADRGAIPQLAHLLDDAPVSANAAAAMGRILGMPWGQNASGVAAARTWWEAQPR